MKKITLLILLVSGLFAVDGEQVFKDNCKACHFGEITVSEFKSQFKAGNVKAPPMIEVANRLKQTITINAKNDNVDEIHRFTVIAFIKEYLKHPSWDYFACDTAAINRFKVMPAQTHLTEQESQAVAEWIYDNFEDKEFK